MQAKQFWTKAYQRNIAKMVGMCCRYVGNRAVAEDLAHEAFLKAIEKSGTYRRLGSFDGWLMRINLNTTMDYLRRQPQFLSMDDDTVGTRFIASESDIVETFHETCITESDLNESEILSAIAALPDKQRTVFNLYVFENQSHAKIAETLQIGVRSSKRYLSEARAQLQIALNNLVRHKKSGLMILLPFLPWKSHAIDRLCRAKLKHLALSPATPSPLSAVNWTAAPKPGVWMAVTAAKAPAVATGVVATAVTGSVVAWQVQPAQTPATPTPQETVVTTCVTTDTATVDADTAVAIVNTDPAVVETQIFASLQTEINEHPTIEKDPEQQVKGTESSVSPLPATSPTSALTLHHGLIKFERNGYYGLKDAHENVVVYPKYSEIQPFDEYRTGWAMVEIFGFKGFVDNAGKEVVHPQYDDIGKFGRYRDGCALVHKGKFYGFIDTTGKEVVPVKFPLQELTK